MKNLQALQQVSNLDGNRQSLEGVLYHHGSPLFPALLPGVDDRAVIVLGSSMDDGDLHTPEGVIGTHVDAF